MRTTLPTALLVCAAALSAQAPPRQTEADAYTRYELLAPASAKFRIVYEVTATTPGATYYFNPIRKGSIATDESVSDRATGKPLQFDVVGAAEARAGGVPGRDSTQTYIRVKLSHPVPADGGEARVLILKTYEDTTSYFKRGDTIVFTRPLGIKRNAVVLPKGYELVSSSFPAQVLQEPDGRVGISFWNETPSEAAVTMRALPIRESAMVKSSVSAPTRRTSPPESRDHVQSPRTGNERIRSLSRLHGITPRNEHVHQRSPCRQHRLQSAGSEPRHGRRARVRDPQGRRDHQGESRRQERDAAE